jgi:guanine deaminase
MCFSAIHWAKIGKIYFGSDIQDAKDAGFSELTISNDEMKNTGKSPVQVFGGFMREENLALFKDFLKKPDNKIY